MSRSKKWRLEWAFFLGENGRRQYNKLCKGCVHPCKQSFRVNPKFCVNSNWGANRAKLIQGGSRVNPAVGLTTT